MARKVADIATLSAVRGLDFLHQWAADHLNHARKVPLTGRRDKDPYFDGRADAFTQMLTTISAIQLMVRTQLQEGPFFESWGESSDDETMGV